MAILHFAVYDDDHELVGMRLLPLNAITHGFRYVSLRDKHNVPLPLETLFVQINVEDWVPDEMEGVHVLFVCYCFTSFFSVLLIVCFLVVGERMIMMMCVFHLCFF